MMGIEITGEDSLALQLWLLGQVLCAKLREPRTNHRTENGARQVRRAERVLQ